jgi:hypothetical protein
MPINPQTLAEINARKVRDSKPPENSLVKFFSDPNFAKGAVAGKAGAFGDIGGMLSGLNQMRSGVPFQVADFSNRFDTNAVGRGLGADTESTEFFAGSLTDPKNLAKAGALAVGKGFSKLKYMRHYLADDWLEKTGIPIEKLDEFAKTGDLQRGGPERAMVRAQQKNVGGVLSPVIEHVGDLSNRASPKHVLEWGREEAVYKAETQLRALRHPYGFERELGENIRSNARFKGVSEDRFRQELNESLSVYADEHRKLPVFNEPQRLGRDAAVAVGEGRYEDAASLLEKFIDISSDEKTYIEALKRGTK